MKSDYTCYSGKEVTLRMLWGAYRLDCEAYPNQYRGALACLGWRHKNPEIYSVVVDNSTRRVVAYTLVMAVSDKAFARLESGDFIDVNLRSKDIVRPDTPGDYCLYVSSIVVASECRKGIPGLLLFKDFQEKIEMCESRGVHFNRIAADILSPEAEQVALHLGMKLLKESSHKSKIYVSEGFHFE